MKYLRLYLFLLLMLALPYRKTYAGQKEAYDMLRKEDTLNGWTLKERITLYQKLLETVKSRGGEENISPEAISRKRDLSLCILDKTVGRYTSSEFNSMNTALLERNLTFLAKDCLIELTRSAKKTSRPDSRSTFGASI